MEISSFQSLRWSLNRRRTHQTLTPKRQSCASVAVLDPHHAIRTVIAVRCEWFGPRRRTLLHKCLLEWVIPTRSIGLWIFVAGFFS